MTAWLTIFAAVLAGGVAMMPPAGAAAAKGEAMSAGHVTGIGGIFFRSKDSKALAAWYGEMLGVKIEAWGGAKLSYYAPQHPAVAVWSPFAADSDYFEPSTREFMVNFAVDDLDAIIARLAAKGVPVLKRDDSDPNGRFAWIVDPDGTKIELWQASGH